MRHILAATAILSIVILLSCDLYRVGKGPKADSTENSEKAIAEIKPSGNDEPLLLDDKSLLLTDEPLMLNDTDTEAAIGADNSRCHVCHFNYTLDELAITHAKAGIDCAGCHGQSDEHIADESWASGGNGTAPGKMYLKNEIDPFCLSCHEAGNLPAEQHKVILVENSDMVCTDCHGDHRLPIRRCKWK